MDKCQNSTIKSEPIWLGFILTINPEPLLSPKKSWAFDWNPSLFCCHQLPPFLVPGWLSWVALNCARRDGRPMLLSPWFLASLKPELFLLSSQLYLTVIYLTCCLHTLVLPKHKMLEDSIPVQLERPAAVINGGCDQLLFSDWTIPSVIDTSSNDPTGLSSYLAR